MRIFFQHHVTWSVNSVCHFFGRRRFDVEDESTNVFWLVAPVVRRVLAPQPSRVPPPAAHGLSWCEVDLSALVIRGMRRVGLAWNVTLIPAARQEAKLAGPGGSGRRAGEDRGLSRGPQPLGSPRAITFTSPGARR